MSGEKTLADSSKTKASIWQPKSETKKNKLEDTALVCVYFGDAPKRRAAVRAGFEKLYKLLDPRPQFVFVELAVEGAFQFGPLQGLADVTYVPVRAEKRHQHLFQKESLWNKGASLSDAKILIWLDADSVPGRASWAEDVRTKLLKLPERSFVQGFSRIVDNRAGLDSASFSFLLKTSGKKHGVPGLTCAMRRQTWKEIKGFNPWFFLGGGDSFFLSEHVPHAPKVSLASSLPGLFKGLMRKKQPRLVFDYLKCTMTHQYHGPLTTNKKSGETGRGYRGRYYLMEPFQDNLIHGYIYRDSKGLLAWTCPEGTPARLAARKGEADTKEDAPRIIAEAERAITCLTRVQFQRIARKEESYSLKGRWEAYLEETISFIRRLPVELFHKQVLEIGPAMIPLIAESERMDVRDFGVGALQHDASKLPWPYSRKQFGLCIMSQVLEHLAQTTPERIEVLTEACRVSDSVLLTLPWNWKTPADHAGINEKSVAAWISNIPGAIVRSFPFSGPGPRRQLIFIASS